MANDSSSDTVPSQPGVTLDSAPGGELGPASPNSESRPATLQTLSSGEGLPGSYPPRSLTRTRYADEGEVARGGMGEIHRVHDLALRRRVAMKLLTNRSDERPEQVNRFCDEAMITGQLDHPNIVPVHDLGVDEEDGRVFFTMKLVEGDTLADVIAELHEGPLVGTDLERVLGVFVRVCQAVAFAHSRRVIHRDLKPDNIMVGSHGQVYVMDWGVALLRDEPSDVGNVVGTAAYMSPEQAWGRVDRTDERTDVYGLGGIIYELLTGRGPHFSEDAREALRLARRGHVEPPEHFAIWPELPPGLCQIAMKALQPEPDDRYQTVDELRRDVEQFLRGGGWFSTRVCRAGEPVVREGDPGDAAYIIVEGHCGVFKQISGERVKVRELGPGEVFGETAVLTNQVRTATVEAIGDVVLKVVTRESLEAELRRNPWLGAFVRALAERFRDVDGQLTRLRSGQKD